MTQYQPGIFRLLLLHYYDTHLKTAAYLRAYLRVVGDVVAVVVFVVVVVELLVVVSA